MSRWALFRKTRFYVGPELMLGLLMTVFLLPICVVGLARAQGTGRVLSEAAALLGGLWGLILLEIVVIRRRYVLDLLFRSAEVYSGRVELVEEIPRSTRMSARSWRLQAVNGTARLLLLEGGPGLAALCRGEVRFLFLKRSRLIVGVLDLEIPPSGQRNRISKGFTK